MNRSLAAAPWQRLVILAALLFWAGLLVGCSRPLQGPRTDLDLRIAFPQGWEVETADQFDTDRDQEPEWVICYTFDNPGNSAFVPIRCAIYDVARREPKLPVIYPYHLQAPGWTYLAEGKGKVSVRVDNVITSAGETIEQPDPEVVVTSQGPAGFVNRVSIFRWYDNIPAGLRNRTDPHEILIVPHEPRSSGEAYECLGMFESTLKVVVETDKVTVVDRIWEDRFATDRSQLARVNVYRPYASRGGYLDENHKLVLPTSMCIDFAHGMPGNVANSPYPEKIVMAFQQTFNQDPGFGSSYLTAEAQAERAQAATAREEQENVDAWRHFAPGLPDVCVRRVSYGPPEETESEMRAFGEAESQGVTDLQALDQPKYETQATLQAPADAPPIRAWVATWHQAPGQPSGEIKLKWTLVRQEDKGTPDGSSTEGQWKIDGVVYDTK